MNLSQSPYLSLIEHHWNVVCNDIGILYVQLTILNQLHDAIIKVLIQISKSIFPNMAESLPVKTKVFLNSNCVRSVDIIK